MKFKMIATVFKRNKFLRILTSSVYALSRDFIVMTSENPGCKA